MGTKEKYQTRLAADDADDVDQYIDDHNLSQSEAVRRLIRAGLEAEAADDEPPAERAAQRGTIYFLIVTALLTLNLVASLGVI